MNQEFQVEGMTCGHCEMAVTRAVKQLDPGAEVKIDRGAGKVEVRSPIAHDTLAQAIAEAGYRVR